MKMRNQILGTYTVKFIIAILVLVLGTFLFLRLDVSRDKIYSLNPQTKKMLGELKDDILIKIYASKDPSPVYANLNRTVRDLLDEYERASHHKVRYEYVNIGNPEELIRKAYEKGIMPSMDQPKNDGSSDFNVVVLGLTLELKDQIRPLTIDPEYASKLEYQISKLIGSFKIQSLPALSVFADSTGINELRSMYGEKYTGYNYEVFGDYNSVPTSLDSLPQNTHVMLVMGVTDSLTTRQLYNLDQFIMRGGRIVLVQDRVKAVVMPQGQFFTENNSNLFTLLEHYGFMIKANIVLDKEALPKENLGLDGRDPAYVAPIVMGSNEFPYTKGFNQIILLLASEIAPMYGSKLKIEPVMKTSNYSNTLTGPVFDLQKVLEQTGDAKFLNMPPLTVGAQISGKMTSYFTADSEYAASDSNFTASTAKGEFIVFGDSDLITRLSNGTLVVLNAIDYYLGRTDMIKLRSRNPQSSQLGPGVYMIKNKLDLADPMPMLKRLITIFQISSVALPILLLGILGGFVGYRRNSAKKLQATLPVNHVIESLTEPEDETPEEAEEQTELPDSEEKKDQTPDV